ncbi:aspartate/glutamate racemase family protein [Parasalinivibrio latis]|uniref:aspartate/glutamate racemase family protein n=1 Tax=Parasalinivibrio latis TaxID=2952610 RepID=UPI0030E26E69
MKIKLINPNTTESMTDKMVRAARLIASAETIIDPATPTTGPASIESHFDEAISVIGVLEQIQKGDTEGTDAYIIACFGDPGLQAARELTSAPVIGIAEAAFHFATLISTRFSVVTTLGRTCIIAEHLLHQYGFAGHCRKVRAAEIPVLELENENGTLALERITAECLRARDEDAIGAIVLGCGGMADLTEIISSTVGLPVIEGVSAAVKMAEGLVSLGLSTSKIGDLAYPRPKILKGELNRFSFTECPPGQ